MKKPHDPVQEGYSMATFLNHQEISAKKQYLTIRVHSITRSTTEHCIGAADRKWHLNVLSKWWYYGRHSSKQYFHGKPICFDSDGCRPNFITKYCVQLNPYQGTTNSELGLEGSDVVERHQASVRKICDKLGLAQPAETDAHELS